MALRQPVPVYQTGSNVEAHVVRNALLASGVEAHVTENVPGKATRAQVWVEQADFDRARAVVDDIDRRSAQRRGGAEGATGGAAIEVVCEECGYRASFATAQRGSMQECPQCGAYLDVPDEELPEG